MKTLPHILIVESEAATLNYIRQTLSPGYNLLSARDALEGVDLLMSERVDLLIIDALLPVLSGAELIRLIRAYEPYSQIPIVAFPSCPEGLHRLNPAHIQGVLPTPFSADELACKVAETLRRTNGHTSDSSAPEAIRGL